MNVASRLESHTKAAQQPVLIDAATRAALGDRIPVEALGPVEVKGRAAPVEAFAVVALSRGA